MSDRLTRPQKRHGSVERRDALIPWRARRNRRGISRSRPCRPRPVAAAITKSASSAMIFANSCPWCMAHAPNSRRTAFFVSVGLRVQAPRPKKKEQPRRKQGLTLRPPAMSKTETNRKGSSANRALTPDRRFFNFFLALEKICAYIRICRRVPKPQEKNPPAETGAAGNFRLRRTIFAKRRKSRCSPGESKLGQGGAMPPG